MPPRAKKPKKPPPEGNFELLFLQLMMIMMAFFILLNAIATIATDKRVKANTSLSTTFGIMPSGMNMDNGMDPSNASLNNSYDTAAITTAEELSESSKRLSIEDKINVIPISKDEVMAQIAEGVGFEFGGDKLLPTAKVYLSSIKKYLTMPDIKAIEIGVHVPLSAGDTELTYGSGNAAVDSAIEQSWRLSSSRALAVFRYLKAMKVKPHKISVAGYGASTPITETPSGLKGWNPAPKNIGDARIEIRVKFPPTRKSLGQRLNERDPSPGSK